MWEEKVKDQMDKRYEKDQTMEGHRWGDTTGTSGGHWEGETRVQREDWKAPAGCGEEFVLDRDLKAA